MSVRIAPLASFEPSALKPSRTVVGRVASGRTPETPPGNPIAIAEADEGQNGVRSRNHLPNNPLYLNLIFRALADLRIPVPDPLPAVSGTVRPMRPKPPNLENQHRRTPASAAHCCCIDRMMNRGYYGPLAAGSKRRSPGARRGDAAGLSGVEKACGRACQPRRPAESDGRYHSGA